jgi:hypothetical protein
VLARTRGTACGLTLAATLLVGIALPAGAGAGLTVGALSYQSGTVALDPGDHVGTLGAQCGAVFPLSGGYTSTTGYGEVVMTTSAPSTSFWAAGYAGNVSIAASHTVSAVCALKAPRYVEAEAEVRAQRRGAVTATCPGKRHLYGGGVDAGPGYSGRIASSFPIDSKDPGNAPDDGWKSKVDNTKPSGRLGVTGWATCGRVATAYRSAEFTVSGGNRGGGTVTCPGELHVVGGGHRVGGGFGATATSTSIPFDTTGWTAAIDTDQARTLEVHTICGDPDAFG